MNCRRIILVRDYPTPQILCPPNTRSQTFELHKLAVINKEVYLGGNLDNIEAEISAFSDGLPHDIMALAKHVLDEPAGGKRGHRACGKDQ